MTKVNRTTLQSYYQNPGDIYDDTKTEGAINTVADQVDANDTEFQTHKDSTDHDERYYTKSELSNGQLDNRYYTETEIDQKINNASKTATIAAGSAFPDGPYNVGQKFFRTDLNQEFTYNGTAWQQTGATQAADIDIQDTSNHFTATDVEGALSELFTFANDGKTQVANAVTAKGVAASPNDTFSALASKIGQILVGKKANGTFLTTASNNNFTVTGLTFQPKLVMWRARDNSTDFAVISTDYSTTQYYLWAGGGATSMTRALAGESSINPDGFTAYCGQLSKQYDWFAFGGW